MEQQFVGYHGTSSECVDSILSTNFRPSTGEVEWLGYGVYFFVDGISDPIKNAEEWACNEAKRAPCYTEYAVLSASASGERVLDATTTEGLRGFDVVRDALMQRHDEHFWRAHKPKTHDRVMWNYNCFSCNKGGDVINFAATYWKLSNSEAFDRLKEYVFEGKFVREDGDNAKPRPLPAPKLALEQAQRRGEILEAATQYYQRCLDGSALAKAYQTEKRKHDLGVLACLRVGFSDGRLSLLTCHS